MILDYYDENYTSRVKKGNYYLLQMGFSWDKESRSTESLVLSKKNAFKKAERVHKLVEKGEDFRTLAKKFSTLPSAVDGGDIGTFTLDEMASAMRDAVANLKHGQLSKIVETPTEYQFYKLLSEKDGSIVITASYDSVKDEIKEKLYQAKLKEAFAGWVADLKKKAYIQKL
jgi:peptidyl-prolyl cis-trans isomerase SurA